MSYRVLVTPAARAQILEHARYVALNRQSPLNAAHWLDGVFDAADTLAGLPRRCPIAPENEFRDYEIRRLLVGDHHLLFTIREAERTVWIIGFRHGGRLPAAEGLPAESPSKDEPAA